MRRLGIFTLVTASAIGLFWGNKNDSCVPNAYVSGNMGGLNDVAGSKKWVSLPACITSSDAAANSYKATIKHKDGRTETIQVSGDQVFDRPIKSQEEYAQTLEARMKHSQKDASQLNKCGAPTSELKLEDAEPIVNLAKTNIPSLLKFDPNSETDLSQKPPHKGFLDGDGRGPASETSAALAVEKSTNDFIESGLTRLQENYGKATEDERAVDEPYTQVKAPDLSEYLGRAKKEAAKDLEDLEKSKEVKGHPAPEVARFTNMLANSVDKIEAAQEILNQELQQKNNFAEQSPFKAILQGPKSNVLAKTPGLSELFRSDGPESVPTSNDALVNRMIKLLGLPSNKRSSLQNQLNFKETAQITLPDGKTRDLTILHNGYILGGGQTGTDCSAFISETLPAHLRKTRLTTLDLRMLWHLARDRKMPKPPLYEAPREELLKKLAPHFVAKSIYGGDTPKKSDMLIFRFLDEASGHVWLVKDYDPVRMRVSVLEAAQSGGSIRERNFDLSLDPLNQKVRAIRPGLFLLRLKNHDTAQSGSCRLPSREIASTAPASASALPGSAR